MSLPFLLPHVIEDFEHGIAPRVGLSGVAAALLGLGLAAQMLGLVLVGGGRWLGLVITSAAGAIQTAGAVWDHGADLFHQGLAFRGSPLSATCVIGLALGQALAVLFVGATLLAGGGR